MPINTHNKIPSTISFIASVIFSIFVIFSGSYIMISLFDNISSQELNQYVAVDNIDASLVDKSTYLNKKDLKSELTMKLQNVFDIANSNYSFDGIITDVKILLCETFGSTEVTTEINNFLTDVEIKFNNLLQDTNVDEKIMSYLQPESFK